MPSGYSRSTRGIALVKDGLFQNPLFEEPLLFEIEANVERLVIENQERALAVVQSRLAKRNITWNLRPFQAKELYFGEIPAFNGRALFIKVSEQPIPMGSNFNLNPIEITLIAISDPQENRAVANKTASLYLGALKMIFQTMSPQELVWRPKLLTESENQYQSWLLAQPHYTLSAMTGHVGQDYLGYDQTQGSQLALVISLEATAFEPKR